MFSIGVILFGFISTSFLRQELFPPIVYPKLTVVTHYANAAPEEIETLITKPIEEAVGSTPGLRNMTSISREGMSLVIAEFGWNQDMDFAALGVREKIDLMKARLPRDAEEPTVVKFNPFELPVLTLSISSDQRNAVQLKRFAKRWIKDEIEKVPGVASATISGGVDEEILVDVDQGRLKASSMGILDISKAISESNLNYPGGTIKENFYEYLVRTMGEFKTLDEIRQIPVGKEEPGPRASEEEAENIPDHQMVLLKDVARVVRQNKEITSFSRFNGKDNLTVSIQKQAQSNTIQVANEILKRIEDLEKQFPADIQTDVIYNQADFVKEAVNGVRDAAVQGGILAFFVLMLFLKDVRTSLLVIVVIPITILATFTLMYFTNISLNVISLGGIALGIGMLIDNAIVVIENIFRHSAEGKPGTTLRDHAIRGTEEVIAPLFASTLTTTMVFLPMIFVTGIAGQIFKELAWVVVTTQVFSMIVAFTLLPVLIATTAHLKINLPPKAQRILERMSAPLDQTEKAYKRILPKFLDNKRKGLTIIFVLFLISVFLFAKYDKIAMPRVDQGQFMMKVDLPVGTRVEYTNRIARALEKYLREIPEVESVSTIVGSSPGTSTKDVIQQIGSNQGQVIVTLKERRQISTDQLIQNVRADLLEPAMRKIIAVADIQYVVYESAFKVGDEESSPVVVQVKGNNLKVLEKLALELHRKIEAVPGIYDVANSIPESAPETKILVNKDKAAFYRLSVTDLATAAHISIKGTVASRFKEEGDEVDIRVVLRERDRRNIAELPFIQMHSPLGINVPLHELVDFQVGEGPSEIKRVGQERTLQVSAKVFDRSLNDVTDDVKKILDGMKPPTGYLVGVAGESQEVKESFDSLRLALILSIVLIYMIMAAQFESYFQPFIVMFTLPLSVIGVSTALGISGTPISVVVILGMILLGGIVVNNGIILIDFINSAVAEGKSVREAVSEAGYVRFRPIFMTAMTSVIGLLPLALGIGEGAKLQAPMAVTVMGGLMVATFLTLVVIPAVYEVASGIRTRLGERKKLRKLAAESASRTP